MSPRENDPNEEKMKALAAESRRREERCGNTGSVADFLSIVGIAAFGAVMLGLVWLLERV